MSRAAARLQRKSKTKDHAPLLTLVKEEQEARRMPVRASREELKPLNDAQKAYRAAILASRITFGIGPAGTGKAQPLDAMIRTPVGWSRMGDLAIGSQVLTADGSTTLVTGVYPQGEKDIYRITFEDGRSTECCDEHLWRVYRHDWGRDPWRVVQLSEIRRMLELKSAQNRLYVELPRPERAFDVALPVDPYLLGLLIGDGHCGRTDLRLTTADSFVVEQVARILPENMKIRHIKGYDYGLVREDVSGVNGGNPLMNALRDLGLHQSRCGNKHIPTLYQSASPSQRWSLLQGLMDADGTVCKTGSTSFCTVSYDLALDVQRLVRSLGGLAAISEKRGKYTYNGEVREGKVAYNIRIRISDPRSLFRLPRKREKLAMDYQYQDLKLRIRSVELVGKKQAQCISVAHPSRLYVTDEFIVTHNTWFAAALAAEALANNEIERIVITRPAQEAVGEKMGFLPGELDEKIEPYFRPVRDAFEERLGSGPTEMYIKNGTIEVRPLAYLRGATLKNCWVLADEMQNATPAGMKMFLTRIGENSRFIINGDPSQKDIDGPSGLMDAVKRIGNLKFVSLIRFQTSDIVRDPMCAAIAEAYETESNPSSARYIESDDAEHTAGVRAFLKAQ